MNHSRKLNAHTGTLLDLLKREERWLITINADPDAMASAMALRRIMSRRVAVADIAKVNEIRRPDNLSMVRYLHIPMQNLSPKLARQYDRFAIVDSQPSHHPNFAGLDYSIVIDHHPTSPLAPGAPEIPLRDIRPEYGATTTILAEYLYNLRIMPGKLLATAMLFGIKTDTNNFERNFLDADVRVYHRLLKWSDHNLLRKIARSEYHISWLPYFTRALTDMHQINSGIYTFVGLIENPDILVFIADFLMGVHELRWAAVSGVANGKIVVIFRGDGVGRDLGEMAAQRFGDVGSAGGHKNMARAEIPVEAAEGRNIEYFVYKRLTSPVRNKHKTVDEEG